jgi:hypothetical protein
MCEGHGRLHVCWSDSGVAGTKTEGVQIAQEQQGNKPAKHWNTGDEKVVHRVGERVSMTGIVTTTLTACSRAPAA